MKSIIDIYNNSKKIIVDVYFSSFFMFERIFFFVLRWRFFTLFSLFNLRKRLTMKLEINR
jgi:hypothetical protein